jgi:hypothetical protein
MPNTFDDFDTQIQPEELQCDNPTDWDFEQMQWEYMNGEFPDDFNDGENW